jgi:hypothetical protein
MKPICLDLKEYSQFSDLKNLNSYIEDLYNINKNRVYVLSSQPEHFKNNPHVLQSYKRASMNMAWFENHTQMYTYNYKPKLLVIVPHMSTGGCPQVTLNKVELLQSSFDIEVVEYSFYGPAYVVQRNKMIALVGEDKFHSLGENKFSELVTICDQFNPEVISMEEFPEMFMNKECSDYLYNAERNWRIVETTHDSSFNPRNKHYLPDQFVFVSAYNLFKYIGLNVPMEVVEYPVDKKDRNKLAKQKEFDLDPNYKHVVIVGLFTARKNQGYAFEMARKLENYKVKFHFIGNQASNFEDYWKPLMANKPDNCIIWGERNDVSEFLQACDMFLFPSKGDRYNKELNPIAIKEALEYDMVKMMYNLDVYCNKYNDYDDVVYLTGDLGTDSTNLISYLNPAPSLEVIVDDEVIVIGTYPNLKRRVELTKQCIESLKPLGRKIILVSHYPVDADIQRMVDYYIYDKHNPMTFHSYYTLFYNYTPDYDVNININQLSDGNQSLAVLTNLFNGFKHAKEHGFKSLFYVTFDIVIDPRDIPTINESFNSLRNGKQAYLAMFKTEFEYGVQTNGMTFNIDYFLDRFDDVRDVETYNSICKNIGSQNFLEDYLAKKLGKFNENDVYIKPTETISSTETFLEYTGVGLSSHSEYCSILPVVGKTNVFMFYFITYNIDDRTVKVRIGNISFEFNISETKEYKHEFAYTGTPVDIVIEFYDDGNMYNKVLYTINQDTLDKYVNTGKFLWKKK